MIVFHTFMSAGFVACAFAGIFMGTDTVSVVLAVVCATLHQCAASIVAAIREGGAP